MGVLYMTYIGLIILYKMTSADDMDNALLACSSIYMYVASTAVMYLYASQKKSLGLWPSLHG